MPRTFYMPVFSKEELIVCQNHAYDMDDDRKQLLLDQYAKWGGSARILFRWFSCDDQNVLESNLQYQLSADTLDQGMKDAMNNTGGMENSNLYPEDSCYLVYHLIPDDDAFNKRRVIFASKNIEFEAKKTLFQKKWQETSLLT